jgi:hypothetical protein
MMACGNIYMESVSYALNLVDPDFTIMMYHLEHTLNSYEMLKCLVNYPFLGFFYVYIPSTLWKNIFKVIFFGALLYYG